MTIPNLITILRIILTPIFIIFLLNDAYLPALILFVVAGISDAIDGLIARLFNQKSKLGAFLDPLADKILLVSAFVVLSAKNDVYAWLAVVVISRDFLILLGVLILFLNSQDFTFKPSIVSKMTTCMQLATVFVALFVAVSADHSPHLHQFSICLFWATGLLTVISCLHYMRQWFRMMGEGPIHD
ncbi:MAG: CDP-diacylglycerol--glycerol-3-phosphate 3-phosphatidyltransferase [Deltaproteobacteria bacterium]|nr:CDP-diacylglycerol--glycerol-3-phosphate 3-phosphatidyltransferase [Deltaproteobacteria bacterium]